MKTKKQIKAAGKDAEAWDERRAWEQNWQASVKDKKFIAESVMEKQPTVTGKGSTILPSRGLLKIAKR